MEHIYLITVLEDHEVISHFPVTSLLQAFVRVSHYFDLGADNWTCSAFSYSKSADFWFLNDDETISFNQSLVNILSSKGYSFNAL